MNTLPDTQILHDVEHVAGIAAAAHYVDLKSQGRTNGPGLLSSVPLDDPDYLTGNAGAIVILHYLIPIIGWVIFLPSFFIGAMPFIAIIFFATAFGHTVATIVGVICLLVYLRVVVWGLICKKLIPFLFKSLVA
jgi:hypothetical protein